MDNTYNFLSAHRILLNIQMITDDIDDLQWSYDSHKADIRPSLKRFALYTGQQNLDDSTIYILRDDAGHFPIDRYSYISRNDVKGAAPHIRNLKQDTAEIVNVIAGIFERYHQFEADINNVFINNGSLTDLCMAGSIFFKNPMYIHDNMFSIIALPRHPEGMLEFEKSKSGDSMHIPLWLINEFRFDEAYQDTLTKHSAAIWGIDQYPKTMRSLYVNLWDGDAYLGRLLINELETSLKSGQFMLAEIFAEYVKGILHRDMQAASKQYRDYEDTIRTVIRNENYDRNDLNDFLATAGWEENDMYLCIKIQSQDPKILIKSDSALRSQLSILFPGSFDFFHEQKLCMIINLSRSQYTADVIKTALATAVRDSLMYCGISNPTRNITNIRSAFQQTDYILNYIKQNSTAWLKSFDECAISYITDRIMGDGPKFNIIMPQLIKLRKADLAKGTEYCKTLRAYLKNERSIPKTAEELIVHRTTLQYRLEKIQSIAPMNLDNEDTRLYLLISFRFYDMIDQ